MIRGLRRLLTIALASAVVGCSLFLQIDDSKIPVEGSDAATSDAADSTTTPEADSVAEVEPEVLQDSVTDDAVRETSIDDSAIDTLDDGG